MRDSGFKLTSGYFLEAVILTGVIAGLTDAGQLVSTNSDLGGSFWVTVSFSNMAIILTVFGLFIWMLACFPFLRLVSGLMKLKPVTSLTLLYFVAFLPVCILTARNQVVFLIDNLESFTSVDKNFLILRYLIFFLPLSWALSYWVAGNRAKYDFPTFAARASATFISLAIILIVIPVMREVYVSEAGTVSEIAGLENTVIIAGGIIIAVSAFWLLPGVFVYPAKIAGGKVLIIIWLVWLLVPLFSTGISERSLEGSPPSGNALAGKESNVILVSIDTTRYYDMGCFGSDIVETPFLDRIASVSTCFDNAVTPIPLTGPAHISVMTGLQPDHGTGHGVRANAKVLEDSVPTLAGILNEHGYTTGAIIGATPLSRAACGLHRGFHYYHDDFANSIPGTFLGGHAWSLNVSKVLRRILLLGGIDTIWLEKQADVVTDQGIQWLENNSDKPFFLFMHYYDPHFPYSAPSE